jgi:hypothetical protein
LTLPGINSIFGGDEDDEALNNSVASVAVASFVVVAVSGMLYAAAVWNQLRGNASGGGGRGGDSHPVVVAARAPQGVGEVSLAETTSLIHNTGYEVGV